MIVLFCQHIKESPLYHIFAVIYVVFAEKRMHVVDASTAVRTVDRPGLCLLIEQTLLELSDWLEEGIEDWRLYELLLFFPGSAE